MSNVEFHFDFGSPNAYLVHKVLPAFEARTGCTITYFPILLGGVFKLTNNKPPFMQFDGTKNKMDYFRMDARRFALRHGLTEFTENPDFPVNTVKIMRGAIVAERAGWLPAYADAVFHHMWENPKNIGDSDVMRRALAESGLDAEAIMTGIEDQAIKDQLLRNTEDSVERGNFGSPTLFVGVDMYFGKERLADVEAEIARQSRA